MSIISRRIRASFGRSDAARDAGLTTPEDVIRYDGIRYGGDAQWQTLDVYRPRGSGEGLLPVIVSVHGGGWVYGSREVYQFYCMSLAQRGFAVVNFSYRLAPENKFPAQMEDVNAVFSWVLEHAGEYGFDTAHVFAVGDSAGGNLLGLYCAFCTNPDYARGFAFAPPEGFAPAAVALNCGHFRTEKKRFASDLNHLLLREFLPHRGSRRELEMIDVTAHVTPRFPPAFVMTSTGDFLREQAPLMERALEAAGVPFVSCCYGDEQNKLGHVFHCDVRSQDAQRCNDEECAFFRRYC